MILCRETNVLGDARHALRESALLQTYYAKDPRENPRDDGVRPGFRSAGVCYEWDGFATFLDVAGPVLRRSVRTVCPPVALDVRNRYLPTDIQLTLSQEGDFFGKHTDAGYVKDRRGRHKPVIAFVYYLGDQDSFTGGQLKFDGYTIEPTDDSLVVFLGSAEAHEVTPVVGDNACRLTINGYFA